ncbi:MAG TPA: maleylpyruvate isomerase N-terminal domain-containing protein [Pyrinomonadaceae bacterium]|nr:maleylpyruvate isomerase N-terminal domain-containing protein [Pyrinomonadaceae bacterium]
MKKSEIMERVRASHQKLTDALEGLSEEDGARKGLTSEWSIKDALSHISAWEIEGARSVREIQAGTWKPRKLNQELIDDFNARAVEERAGRSFAELREEFDRAHNDMEQVIASLPDEIDEKSPAYKFIEGVTFEHHAHHAAQIANYRNK